ncbi:MAG: FAD synthase [Candidatus Thorarchaeota archaeon]|nr:MAG: FAD synthase [Candidatus Thorarchaeota archaeon]
MSGKRVLAAGKFDILHLGHLAYLEQAKQLAGSDGKLIVVIARDKTIREQRGAPPVFPQDQRRELLEALHIVDQAIIGYDTRNHTDIVEDIKPDIIALGYDQKTDIDALKQLFSEKGLTTEIVRLKKRKADGLCSSTSIRKRIIKYYTENGRVRD